MQKGFVFLDEVLYGISWDAKYATSDNITGKPVDGYKVNRIAGTTALAEALLFVERLATDIGFGLLLWDAYRPQRAVDHFLKWSKLPEDGLTKKKYYPNIDRTELITKGYIAVKSSHSRGSAVDLTLFRIDTGTLLPMGSGFDFMDERSHFITKDLCEDEAKNRQLLRFIMEKGGFKPYAYEWWHFELLNEPYPDSYFDFVV